MTNLSLIAAGVMMTVTSCPVVAGERAATTTSVEQPAAPNVAQAATRYCVIDTVTGSRIPIKKCLTRNDWLKEGFDPLNPDK